MVKPSPTPFLCRRLSRFLFSSSHMASPSSASIVTAARMLHFVAAAALYCGWWQGGGRWEAVQHRCSRGAGQPLARSAVSAAVLPHCSQGKEEDAGRQCCAITRIMAGAGGHTG